MENASKALLMAGGILIGVLILALIATLFLSSKEMNDSYNERKNAEAIQKFNTNFTKYLGRTLTIHEVVTICNYAKENNVEITSPIGTTNDIKHIVELYQKHEDSIRKYKLKINEYKEGYISSIELIEI